MSRVYRVTTLDGETVYCGTARDVDALPDGYESAEKVDAVEELELVNDHVRDVEGEFIFALCVIRDLIDRCPPGELDRPEWKAARMVVDGHPLPPAQSDASWSGA